MRTSGERSHFNAVGADKRGFDVAETGNRRLKQARIGSAIDDDVLAGDVGCLGAAKKGADGAEFRWIAEPVCGDSSLQPLLFLIDRNAGFSRSEDEVVAHPGRLEPSRKKSIDRDVLCGQLPREYGHCAHRSGPRADRKPEPRVSARRLHGSGCDRNDAAELALGHSTHHRARQHDGRQHVGIDGLEPGVAVHGQEIAGGRSACIVDEDIRIGAGGEEARLTVLRGNVGCQKLDLHPRRQADFVAGLRQGRFVTGVDKEIYPFTSKCEGACPAETLRGRADDRRLPTQTEIHHDVPYDECPNGIASATIQWDK